MFEVGDSVKCLDTFYIRQCNTFFSPGRIFMVEKVLIQGNKQYLYPFRNDETNCDEFDVELVKEGKMYNVGNRVKWTNSFDCKEEYGYIDEINTEGHIWVNWDKRMRTWAGEKYWIEQGLEVIEEATMFGVGDKIRIIEIHESDAHYSSSKELVGEKGEIMKICQPNYPLGYFNGKILIEEKEHIYYFIAVKIKKIKEEVMHKFEVGKKIRCVNSVDSGSRLTFEKIYELLAYYPIALNAEIEIIGDDGCRTRWREARFIEVEETTMSKYQELKERIEKVKGWDKEADDIIEEIRGNKGLGISIYFSCKEIKLTGNCIGYTDKMFIYTDQCSKLETFKKALLYLLDHSDIKDEKEEKIGELMKQIESAKKVSLKYASEVHSLESQIEELRR